MERGVKVRANASFYSPDVNRIIEKNQNSIRNIEKWVQQKKINEQLFEAVENGILLEVKDLIKNKNANPNA